MANYGINIDINIRKQRKLNELNSQLEATGRKIDGASKSIQKLLGDQNALIRSYNDLNRILRDANKEFNRVALGTPQAKEAARNLINVNNEVNKGLEERAKLLKQVSTEMAYQEKMAKLREKGIRPRTMFSGPIGPGQATSAFRGKVEANVARSREIREIAAAGSNRAGLGGGFKEFNKNVKKIQADTKKMRGTLAQLSASQFATTAPFGVRGGNIGPALPPPAGIFG